MAQVICQQIDTMAAALRAAAEDPAAAPNQPAIVLLDAQRVEQRLTYPALWNEARVIAAGLYARGVRPGDRVVLVLPTSHAYVVSLCSAIILGVVPCTIAAPTSRAKTDLALGYLDHVCKKLDPRLLIVAANLQQHIGERLGAYVPVVTVDQLRDDGSLPIDLLPDTKAADPHHIQLTSGSTSMPKGVLLSNANVVSNMRAIARAVGFVPGLDSGLSWLPLYHDMGLIQLLMAIFFRSTLVLMTPASFIRNPLSWLQNIARYQASLSAAPTFAYSLCVQRFDSTKLEGVDLSTWRYSFVGAEPVRFSILERFMRCFQPYGLAEQAIFPCYGMAETVLATTLPIARSHPNRIVGHISCDRIDSEALRQQGRAVAITDRYATAETVLEVVGCGHPAEGLEISIRTNGHAVGAREVGEIWVRGTSVMQGYFNDPVATAQAMFDDWYRTGDRGYMFDGELYVLGRIKELVIVRGRNYHPEDIEAVIEEHAAVRQGYTVVFGVFNAEHGTDDIVAVVETKAQPAEHVSIAREIQRTLQQVFGFLARELVFVPHGSVPRTTSGKRQRVLTEEWYRAGMLKAQSRSSMY